MDEHDLIKADFGEAYKRQKERDEATTQVAQLSAEVGRLKELLTEMSETASHLIYRCTPESVDYRETQNKLYDLATDWFDEHFALESESSDGT